MGMREHVLVLADVHANRSALVIAVTDARKRYLETGLSTIWCLGDQFGRGTDPVGAWCYLEACAPEVVLAGNHDWGVIGLGCDVQTPVGWDGPFRGREWELILAHQRALAQVGLLAMNGDGLPHGGPIFDTIRSLPVLHSPRPGVYLVHGGLEWPHEPQEVNEELAWHLVWDYVRTPADAARTLEAMRWIHLHASDQPWLSTLGGSLHSPALVLVGHWHRRVLHYGGSNGRGWVNPVQVDFAYELDPGPERPILISPGSVGFPREDLDRGASYAVLCLEDGRARSVTFHRAEVGAGPGSGLQGRGSVGG